MSAESGFSSPDRKVRLETLEKVSEDRKLSKSTKLDLIKRGLDDEHDSIRSKAVELLAKGPYTEAPDMLVGKLVSDKYWAVRIQILRKFDENATKWNIIKYREPIISMTKDLKPYVRVYAAKVITKHPFSNEWNIVLDMYYDKDPEVRKEIHALLEKSPDPGVKSKIDEINRKIREKEEKKKQLQGMFEGI